MGKRINITSPFLRLLWTNIRVNYSDGTVPLDWLFGTWHDGSAEGEALMEARFAAKKGKGHL
jgi:hypothetical protein